MGGSLPLGYDRHPDPQRRELVVNEAEAQTVQQLFVLYADLGNLRLVEIEAARLGLRPKQGTTPAGKVRGSAPFTRGQLHYFLRNPLYRGRIRHKDQDYPGQHPAIVDADLWDAVQLKLMAAKARPRGRSHGTADPRLLTGKLRDETGDILTPAHAQRRGRRFAYYVSHRLIAGGRDPTGWRLPAEALEATLRRLLAVHLREQATRHGLMAVPEAVDAVGLAQRGANLAAQMATHPSLFATLIGAATLEQGQIRIRIDADTTAKALGIAPDTLSPDLLDVERPFTLRRRGVETRIVAGETEPLPDPVLVRTLAEARICAASLRAGTTLAEIAASTRRSEPYIRTRVPLAFPAPRLQAAILDGRQPPNLSVAGLLREGIPMSWDDQARLFGNI